MKPLEKIIGSVLMTGAMLVTGGTVEQEITVKRQIPDQEWIAETQRNIQSRLWSSRHNAKPEVEVMKNEGGNTWTQFRYGPAVVDKISATAGPIISPPTGSAHTWLFQHEVPTDKTGSALKGEDHWDRATLRIGDEILAYRGEGSNYAIRVPLQGEGIVLELDLAPFQMMDPLTPNTNHANYAAKERRFGWFTIKEAYKIKDTESSIDQLLQELGFTLPELRDYVDYRTPSVDIDFPYEGHTSRDFNPGTLYWNSNWATGEEEERYDRLTAALQGLFAPTWERLDAIPDPFSWFEEMKWPEELPEDWPSILMKTIAFSLPAPTETREVESTAFVEEEKERARRHFELEELLRKEMDRQGSGGDSPMVYHIPDIMLWHPRLAEVYNEVCEASDYRHVIGRQEAMLHDTLDDDAFWDHVPDSFVLMSVGPADSLYESWIVMEAQERGKRVEKYIALEEIASANADAYTYMAEFGVPVETIQGWITAEDLRKIRIDNYEHPIVCFAQDVINFCDREEEERFNKGIVGSLTAGDLYVTSKPICQDEKEVGAYDSSKKAGWTLLDLCGCDGEKWRFNGFRLAEEQIYGSFSCVEQDGKYIVDDEIRFLHSSRIPIGELLPATPVYQRSNGHEISAFRI